MSEIISQTHVMYQYLTELKEKNFNVEEKTLIDLIITDKEDNEIEKRIKPNLILFISENKLSKSFLKIFLQLAKEIKDDKCELCYCNLDFEDQVLKNFKILNEKENLDHPFRWAKFVESPFILGYKEGWPVGIYNYSVDVQSLIEFCNEYMVFGGKKLSKEYKYRPEIFEFNKEKSIEALKYQIPDLVELYDKGEEDKIDEITKQIVKNDIELKKVQDKEFEGDYKNQTVAKDY